MPRKTSNQPARSPEEAPSGERVTRFLLCGNRKTCRWLRVVAVVAILGGVTWHASRRVPTGPAQGDAARGRFARAAADRRTIRIGTFNIHGCTGRDRRRDVDRVADCLRDLDFVGLNEVHGAWFWQPADQAELLGRRLDRAWLFAPSVRQWYHFDFGNGLLTTLQVTAWQRIPLCSSDGDSPRNVVLARLRHRSRTLNVLVTHLARRDPLLRQEQLRAVCALFLTLAEPAILLGDMNADATDPQIRQLLATPGVVDPVGQASGPGGPPRIDWIFIRGLRAVGAAVVDHGASDHPLVWAEVESPE